MSLSPEHRHPGLPRLPSSPSQTTTLCRNPAGWRASMAAFACTVSARRSRRGTDPPALGEAQAAVVPLLARIPASRFRPRWRPRTVPAALAPDDRQPGRGPGGYRPDRRLPRGGRRRRTGWRVTGEDSHFAWKAIEAGIPIYYQPEAVVRHRIPANRMNRRFLLARCYARRNQPSRHRGEAGNPERRAPTRPRPMAPAPRPEKGSIPRDIVRRITPWNDPRVIEALSQISLSISIVRRGAVIWCRSRALSRP